MRERGRALLAGDVVWFPVRHHSPACARGVASLIAERRPWAVLVEGPPSFADVVEHLVDPEAVMPLAVYTHAVVTSNGRDGDVGEHRYSAYYPLCDYSPELVALRAGAAIGARLGFVDLDYDAMARLGYVDGQHALVDERAYLFSTALDQLARDLGCRDHNDLWDQLIESAAHDLEDLVSAVATYGTLARLGTPPDSATLARDDAREAEMVAQVRHWLAIRDGEGSTAPIVVVTGAFHTAVLPELFAADTPDEPNSPVPAARVVDSRHGLVRYSFERLDALSGYAAGMPSPAWYQDLWDHGEAVHAAAEAARRTLHAVAAELRLRGRDGQPATASLVDAHAHVELLRRLRNRAAASRCDVSDAALSCFAKGEYGYDVSAVVAQQMTGRRVGRLAPGTPRAPLGVDFDRRAASLRLPIETSAERRVELEIYRSDRDREVSRFLHSLTALGVAYARAIQTPRWTSVAGRDVTREIWICRLSAETDMTIAEASMWGSTVEEAVASWLRQAFHELTEAQATSVTLLRLVQTAAQCGAHEAVGIILAAVRERIAGDPDLHTVAEALTEADLLRSSRQPLDGAALASLPAIGEQLYLRACTLIPQLDTTPDDASGRAVEDLRRVHHVVSVSEWLVVDRSLLIGALAALRSSTTRPEFRGAVDGLMWHTGLTPDDELLTQCAGHLAAVDGAAGADYLAGLIAAARESLWEVAGLIDAIGGHLSGIDDVAFLRRLPALRAVFAMLAPRETDRLAQQLALGGIDATARVRDVGEQSLIANLAASLAVTERLEADGFGAWLSGQPEPGEAND